jgi:hypothetical protein
MRLLSGAIALAMVIVAGAMEAQPYVDGGETRHRFAQLTLGGDARTFPAGGSTAAGALQETRFIIGGTHFWGHADFFIALPILRSGDSDFRTRVETGARWYPWRLESGKVRPYVGASLMGVQYEQGDGPRIGRMTMPVTAGLTYQRNDHIVTLGVGRTDYEAKYPLDAVTRTDVRMHPTWISLGYTRSLETTLSAEEGWASGQTAARTERALARGLIGGFNLAVGPSSAFFLRESSHLRAVGSAGQHLSAELFPEIGAGWYFAKPDVQVNLAFRRNSSEVAGYGYEHTARRTSVAAEAYAFLFDYQGFVPFIGPHVSHEWLRVEGDANGTTSRFAPGLTFGWDIRPDRLQLFTLRTALRWTPGLSVRVEDGRRVPFDQLEFNFIQFVLYPGKLF